MAEQFDFELVFELADGVHDPYVLSDAIFGAGYENAIIGTGDPRLLGVALEAEGHDAENVILETARQLLKVLPEGTRLREVRPDLVSLADVAEKLNIKRQALQKREDMPLPTMGGLYRVDEMADALLDLSLPGHGRRKPRFDVVSARKWLLAGRAARQLNALLTIRAIDPVSMEIVRSNNRRDRTVQSG
jgi:hypothetical protein